MSSEANSRHTTPTVRWGETAAEVPGANITEPSGGKKDTGWVPGVDRPNGNWWNWLHWADGVFHRYVENLFALLWPNNSMLPRGGSTGAATTNGAGLSVDVTSATVWLQGAFYVVPLANDLALAAADGTHPRIDLVVARLNAGVPEYFAVTGTPAASPVAPSASSAQVPVAQVRVNAGATTPTSITDVRLFGDVRADQVITKKYLQAGDIGGGDYILDVDWSGGGAGAGVNLGNGVLVVSQTALVVDPEVVSFTDPITRKLDLPAPAFLGSAGNPSLLSTGWSGTSGDDVMAPVQLHRGATIKAVRLFGTKTGATTPNLVLRFLGRNKETNAVAFTEGPVDNAGGPIGDFVLEITGLSRVVGNQDNQLQVRVSLDDTGGTILLYGGEVEYEESEPFDGI